MKGFFDAFARVAGIFATQTVLQQLVWILMCIVIGIFLMVACYIALKHFYNKSGERCQVCGSFGHVAAECMEMGMPSACRCQLCGAFGHLARVCSRFPGTNKSRYFPGMFSAGGGGCHPLMHHSHSTSCCETSTPGCCGGHSHGVRRSSHHCHHRRRYHRRHYGGRKCGSNCAHGVILNAYGVTATPPQTKDGKTDIGFKVANMMLPR